MESLYRDSRINRATCIGQSFRRSQGDVRFHATDAQDPVWPWPPCIAMKEGSEEGAEALRQSFRSIALGWCATFCITVFPAAMAAAAASERYCVLARASGAQRRRWPRRRRRRRLFGAATVAAMAPLRAQYIAQSPPFMFPRTRHERGIISASMLYAWFSAVD